MVNQDPRDPPAHLGNRARPVNLGPRDLPDRPVSRANQDPPSRDPPVNPVHPASRVLLGLRLIKRRSRDSSRTRLVNFHLALLARRGRPDPPG
jgi:hypothetical protein